MNPFGNIDEPTPPQWFRDQYPHTTELGIWLAWYIRNPLHNFTHYQIGWSGIDYAVQEHGEEGPWRDADHDGFADDGGWLRLTLWRWDGATRPYVSYAGKKI